MDIIYDLYTLRNVNRPYTKEELEEMHKKDHSIKEEDKKSRLQRCVSFNDPDYDNYIIIDEKDTNKKASSSFIEKDDKPSTHVADTILCDVHVSSNKPFMITNDSIFSTIP